MTSLNDTSIKYISKDFQGFKRDLMRYAQAHFSGSYQDYNEASPGMMLLELQAYVGDVLAFYMDQQFLELRSSTARQLENIEEFAKMRGYRPKGLRSARVPLSFVVEVPVLSGALPDPDYLPVLRAGSQGQGPASVMFETLEDLDFGVSTHDNPQRVAVSRTDVSNKPTYVAVRRWVDAVAGKTVVEQIPVNAFSPFKRIALGQTDVQEVIDVFDREGNQWYEVEHLAQNVVFDQVTNTEGDVDVVPYVLKWRSASRRFVVDRVLASNVTYLQFGPGNGVKFDDELIPNMANLALPVVSRTQFGNFTLDPQNFLKTRTLGLSPANTTLTVRYRVGGGTQTNVPAYSIKRVQGAQIVFKKSGLVAKSMSDVQSSIEVTNDIASEGGGDAESVSEIKVNAGSYFAAQARAVTREDFLTHVLSMPARFGRPEKVFVKNSDFNPLGVDLHVLSIDSGGHLQHATPTLKQNIQTYLRKLRMLTEGITILDANIIDLSIEFGVVISSKFNRAEVVANCILALADYTQLDNMQIGMPLVLSDIQALLQSVNGVISVYKFEFKPKMGAPYASDVSFDVDANTKNGIIYCPLDSVFEVRFPSNDISGASR
jgi:hypothetical protein